MDVVLIVITLLIGVIGGFIAGLVGIGGAIIIYPMIILIPPLFGLEGFTAYTASGLTSAQVFFSTLSGTARALKRPIFNVRLIGYMGVGMIVGSVVGAILSQHFTEQVINYVYIAVSISAIVLMIWKVKPAFSEGIRVHWSMAIVGVFIGLISGVIGAGGAFIIIPILLTVYKLPMNTVVTNSIVIAFISSIGAFVMKLFQGFVPLEHAIWMVIGSLVMTPIGMKVGEKVPDAVQKAIIIILIAIAIIQLLT